jgi:hypothetical protein
MSEQGEDQKVMDAPFEKEGRNKKIALQSSASMKRILIPG